MLKKLSWFRGRPHESVRKSFDDITNVGVRGEAVYDEELGEFKHSDALFSKPEICSPKVESKESEGESDNEFDYEDVAPYVEEEWQYDEQPQAEQQWSENQGTYYDDYTYQEQSTPYEETPYAEEEAWGPSRESEDFDKENVPVSRSYPNMQANPMFLGHSDTHSSLKSLKPRATLTAATPHRQETASNYTSPESRTSTSERGHGDGEGEEDYKEDDDDVEVLFSKLRHGHTDYVRRVLSQGFDVETVDACGNSLLHICAQNNNKKMAALVLSFDCPVNVENKKGMTALDYAHLYKFVSVASFLSEYGADFGRKYQSQTQSFTQF